MQGDYGDYGEVSCDVTDNTYSSVPTVPVVSAGVQMSRCLKVGKLLLGSGEGVHLDTASVIIISSHHNPVLEVNSTSPAEIEDDNNNNIKSDY